MSDASSDDFPGMDFAEFSAQDFAQIDAVIASHSSNRLQDNTTTTETFNTVDTDSAFKVPIIEEPVEVDGGYSDVETLPDIVMDGGIADADVSFNSDGFDLNLSALTADELAKLDGEPSDQNYAHNGGPSITIELEEAGEHSAADTVKPGENNRLSNGGKPSLPKSPLDEFRSHMSLSVTDLVSPAWCEVQYDYGLRGKRSRSISHRPKSFVSSTGKIISPEVSIARTNDVRTRQGLAVHKELERQIKFEELQVEITTDETRWALRIVNMLACLKSVMSGLTREMPVFGVLHGEVVVGIMDEVIKEEATFSKTNSNRNNKRPSDGPRSPSNSKKARTEPPSPQKRIDSFFESPKKSRHKTETTLGETSPSPSPKTPGYILHIKDNKTRKNKFIPSESDMFSGRMQLMIYRRLLSELVSTNPPYDFSLFWRKVNVDSKAIFPTKFLVQAHLIEETDGFKSTCLDDLVSLWQSEVKELNILGVDQNLELVYRLRPPPATTVKSQKMNKTRPPQTISDEERDLKLAIAASLEGTSEAPRASVGSCPPTLTKEIAAPRIAEKPVSDPFLDVEDVEMQWAIAESNLARTHSIGSAVSDTLASEQETRKRGGSVNKGKGKEKEHTEIPEEEDIRRFKIIGTKKFRHNDEELDRYLDHVLEWWRGERKPEGVPLERVNRCLTCEYINDCEWRDQKALEFTKKKRPTLS